MLADNHSDSLSRLKTRPGGGGQTHGHCVLINPAPSALTNPLPRGVPFIHSFTTQGCFFTLTNLPTQIWTFPISMKQHKNISTQMGMLCNINISATMPFFSTQKPGTHQWNNYLGSAVLWLNLLVLKSLYTGARFINQLVAGKWLIQPCTLHVTASEALVKTNSWGHLSDHLGYLMCSDGRPLVTHSHLHTFVCIRWGSPLKAFQRIVL